VDAPFRAGHVVQAQGDALKPPFQAVWNLLEVADAIEQRPTLVGGVEYFPVGAAHQAFAQTLVLHPPASVDEIEVVAAIGWRRGLCRIGHGSLRWVCMGTDSGGLASRQCDATVKDKHVNSERDGCTAPLLGWNRSLRAACCQPAVSR
jgi:hypothetical protein